ncbi:MAG: FtsQ-type POTRA domain-containing protein [Prevotella sp.]|nr:FtsQ-type POTRA domain-containing protein [Prevotella sp.]
MNVNWKKISVILIDIALTVYLVLAITVFNRPDEKANVCNDVKIGIAGGVVDGFLTQTEIKHILQQQKLYPKGLPMAQVNTRAIEDALNQNPLVEQAQCYKSQNGNLHIELTQRLPVLRVKAENGDDYYIDNHGGIMPNTRYTSNLVVATGAIDKKYAKRALSRIGNIIVHDKFWCNQIEQLNVLSDGSVELVPRVGDHVVYLGRPVNIRQKLDRLQKFYLYGLSQAGWNKYAYISLEFDNQIICTKRNAKQL